MSFVGSATHLMSGLVRIWGGGDVSRQVVQSETESDSESHDMKNGLQVLESTEVFESWILIRESV